MGKMKSKALTTVPKSATGIDATGTPEAGLSLNITDVDAVKHLFGTDHKALANALLMQCLYSLNDSEMSDDRPQIDGRQFLLEMVAELEPRDGIERMLAVQMVTTHVHMMRAGRRIANAEMLPQLDAQQRAHSKLARSFTAQLDALRKHRNGGKQTVTVQHVNVAGGGQAIVGDVSHRGEG